jgi:hypothetical protein
MTRRLGQSAALACLALAVLALAAGAAPSAADTGEPTATSQLLRQDVLINADIWERQPRMMAAGLGFTNIIGVPGLSVDDLAGSEARARAVGGTWNTVSCATGETPALSAYTSASTPEQVAFAYGFPTTISDGLPVEFSWPIRPSTLDPTDFRVTLSNGGSVTPDLASVYPNAEYNERSVAVLFGHFGNRLPPEDRSAVYPVRTTVVPDVTPLQLVGPDGRLASAVGFSATSSTTPYADPSAPPAQRTGPHLVAAKLTRISTRGEDAPGPFSSELPNDGVTLYGEAAAFRLRVFTSGGFSPDGVRAVFPTEFSRYFRLRARGEGGKPVLLEQVGVDYHLAGHVLRILGLADLGHKASQYDDCYTEDKDNQIDIILGGDEAAARRITDVELPASGRYSPFYNPGGPGNSPTPGVRYTAPGPAQVQSVTKALGDPMTVTFIRPSP